MCNRFGFWCNASNRGKTFRASILHKSYTVVDLEIKRGAWQNHKHLFLLKLYGSGGGIRTPDTWIMIPLEKPRRYLVCFSRPVCLKNSLTDWIRSEPDRALESSHPLAPYSSARLPGSRDYVTRRSESLQRHFRFRCAWPSHGVAFGDSWVLGILWIPALGPSISPGSRRVRNSFPYRCERVPARLPTRSDQRVLSDSAETTGFSTCSTRSSSGYSPKPVCMMVQIQYADTKEKPRCPVTALPHGFLPPSTRLNETEIRKQLMISLAESPVIAVHQPGEIFSVGANRFRFQPLEYINLKLKALLREA